MDSLWLCCDPKPSQDLKDLKGKQQLPNRETPSSPILGIFTEDPAIIARRIKRPTTPGPLQFHKTIEIVPVAIPAFKSQAFSFPTKHQQKALSQSEEVITHECESPPSHGPFFGSSRECPQIEVF